MTLRASKAGGATVPLSLGFGTDGAEREILPWLAQNVAAIFTILLSLALISLLGALVYALWRELRRNTIVLEPLEVPRELAERGYTPAVVTERLLDAIHTIQSVASTQKPRRGHVASALQADIRIPVGQLLNQVVRALLPAAVRPTRPGARRRDHARWGCTHAAAPSPRRRADHAGPPAHRGGRPAARHGRRGGGSPADPSSTCSRRTTSSKSCPDHFRAPRKRCGTSSRRDPTRRRGPAISRASCS